MKRDFVRLLNDVSVGLNLKGDFPTCFKISVRYAPGETEVKHGTSLPCHGLAVSRRSFTVDVQPLWDLRGTNWQWNRFFCQYFGFLLSASFHRCSVLIRVSVNEAK